jgi:hypothetical protein
MVWYLKGLFLGWPHCAIIDDLNIGHGHCVYLSALFKYVFDIQCLNGGLIPNYLQSDTYIHSNIWSFGVC